MRTIRDIAALGGKTAVDNAQICCRMHNSKMGKKPKAA
jgi:hypothetical protein